MPFSAAGQCSSRATIVVTASGGGRQDIPCAMAVRICRNFTKPIASTKTIIAASISIIRFLMRSLLLAVQAADIDSTVLEQRAAGSRHFGTRSAVISERRDLVEPCA